MDQSSRMKSRTGSSAYSVSDVVSGDGMGADDTAALQSDRPAMFTQRASVEYRLFSLTSNYDVLQCQAVSTHTGGVSMSRVKSWCPLLSFSRSPVRPAILARPPRLRRGRCRRRDRDAGAAAGTTPTATGGCRASAGGTSHRGRTVSTQVARASSMRSIHSATRSSTTTRTRCGTTRRRVLQQDAQWLAKWPQTVVRVDGHCDERGTAEYNLALGDRRADGGQGIPDESRRQAGSDSDAQSREGGAVLS